MKQVSAILMGDLHMRENIPICRTDDYIKAMETKLAFICKLQQKHNCPVFDSGDLFDKWKASPSLINFALRNLPQQLYSVPGNHDLPQHNLELINKSGFGVLQTAGILYSTKYVQHINQDKQTQINYFPWGAELYSLSKQDKEEVNYNIAIAHVMTYIGRKPYPGCTDPGGNALLKKMTGYDLVLTGHNHIPFVCKDKDNRILVNPGSIMRSNSDQIDHKPRVYLWYAETNEVEAVYLPIEENVISRDHIISVEEREQRAEAFVQSLSENWEAGLSFEKNLDEFFKTENTPKHIQQIIRQVME